MFIASYSHLVFVLLTLEALDVDKPSISIMIVNNVRNATPPSRFLRLNPVTLQWEELSERRAVERVSQMLRQNPPAANTGGITPGNTTIAAEGVAIENSLQAPETVPV